MDFNSLVNTLREIDTSDRQSIFESIGNGDLYFSRWEREIHPILCEVALSADQIEQLFTTIENDAGRNTLGKISDAGSKISDAWFNKFGGMLQNSAPVEAFDQKWEDIKNHIGNKNPELARKLAKYGEFAKNNPKTHKFLLAIAGSVAAALGISIAGGAGAGALAVGTGAGVATGILNIADRLLQGQKASTAIGRGATTGAIVGLTAGAAAKIGELISSGIQSHTIAKLQGLSITQNDMSYNSLHFSAVTKPPETAMLTNAFNAMDVKNSESVKAFADILAKVSTPEYRQQISATREIAKATKEAAASALGVINDLKNITTIGAGGVASAATNQQPRDELSESQVNELFGITGNKIDANKLKKKWEKAGSPTDSEDIVDILLKAGVSDEAITQAFENMSLPDPFIYQDVPDYQDEDSDISDILDQISALSVEEQRAILDQLGL